MASQFRESSRMAETFIFNNPVKAKRLKSQFLMSQVNYFTKPKLPITA